MKYDVVVVGGGPAGVTAAIYSKRYGLKVMVIAPTIGGKVVDAPEIENYPGFKRIKGADLGLKFREHLEFLNIEILEDKVYEIKKEGEYFNIKTEFFDIKAKAVIITTGMKERTLGIGEDKYLGKGVSYCAVCDAPFYQNKKVVVVGGGDGALGAAYLLTQHNNKVIVLYRSKIRAEQSWIDKTKDKVEFVKGEVKEILGEDKLEKIKVFLKDENKEVLWDVDGLFVYIGSIPVIDFKGIDLEKDERGYIKVDNKMKTNIEGIFAAGDITTGHDYFHQIIIAAAEGAIAAKSAYEYLQNKELEK